MNHSEIILYRTEDGTVKIDTIFQSETIWLTQKKMAELFDVQRPAITKHLKNIFESGELDEQVVSSILEHTTQHGAIEGKTQTKETKYYNLDAIIAVGYRVNSKRATQFRIWSTAILKEYIIKGFAMDDERLKKSRISILPPLITTKIQKRHSFYLRKYRIKCSGLLPVKLPQNSLNLEATPTSQIWDLPHGVVPLFVNMMFQLPKIT